MRANGDLFKGIAAGLLLLLVPSACGSRPGTGPVPSPGPGDGVQITLLDVYEGVQDGNTESVQLPDGRAFLTVEMCLDNLSALEQSILWQEVYLTSGDLEQIHPVAVGYNQAEAFSWLMPIAEPIGGKRMMPRYYFFLLQGQELLRLPGHQSVGCTGSAQYKSFALLFTVPRKRAGQPYTLRFYNASISVRAQKTIGIPRALIGALGLGGVVLMTAAVLFIRRSRARANMSGADGDQDRSEGI
jgi:hypothetical protein